MKSFRRLALVLILPLAAACAEAGSFMAPNAPPAFASGTMSVSIAGPTAVPPGSACVWSAHVTGGTQPYTYRWTRNNVEVSTDHFYWGADEPGGDFSLDLFVWDADNRLAATGFFVTEDPFASCR